MTSEFENSTNGCHSNSGPTLVSRIIKFSAFYNQRNFYHFKQSITKSNNKSDREATVPGAGKRTWHLFCSWFAETTGCLL